jgi:hypothetical protein
MAILTVRLPLRLFLCGATRRAIFPNNMSSLERASKITKLKE